MCVMIRGRSDALRTRGMSCRSSGLRVARAVSNLFLVACIPAVLLLTPAGASAQDTLWTRTYGGSNADFGYSVAVIPEGGFVLTGETHSVGAGGADVFLVRTDATGGMMWSRTYGGTLADIGYSVAATGEGGFVVTGSTESAESAGPGNQEIYLIRTDALGDTLWTRTYGGPGLDAGLSVAQTMDGGFIVTGFVEPVPDSVPWRDLYLLRVDASGDSLWATRLGGSMSDRGRSVQETSDGGFIVSGDLGGRVYLVRTDAAGDTLWTRRYGNGPYLAGFEVRQTSDGGFAVLASSDVFEPLPWLIRTDATGDTLWTRHLGLESQNDHGESMDLSDDDGFVITGYSYWPFNLLVIRADETGGTLWRRAYGANRVESGQEIRRTPDGDFVVVGRTSSFGAGSNDAWLLRISDSPAGMGDDGAPPRVPSGLSLSQNHPNPFNPSTTIRYRIPAASGLTGSIGSGTVSVKLAIYDIRGRRVRTLVRADLPPGPHEVAWDGRSDLGMTVPSGAYLYTLHAGGVARTRKMILLK